MIARPLYYILKGTEVVPANDIHEWAEYLQNDPNRIIRKTEIKGVTISTVFLGIDHNFSMVSTALPIVFETMIFGGKHDGYQHRDATYADAVETHEKVCKLVRKRLNDSINR